MQNKKIAVVSVFALLLLFAVGGYVYKTKQTQGYEALIQKKAKLLQRDHSMVIGNKNAKVQLVEFFDPACGTCAQFHYHVKDIMKKNEGQIKLVLRYAPFHKNSFYAVKMLEAARAQGKFMEVLDFMFRTQKYWIEHHEVKVNTLWKMLYNVKDLDMDKMNTVMNEKTADKFIAQDLQDAESLQVTKTPSYFVNGQPLEVFGLKPLKELIHSQL